MLRWCCANATAGSVFIGGPGRQAGGSPGIGCGTSPAPSLPRQGWQLHSDWNKMAAMQMRRYGGVVGLGLLLAGLCSPVRLVAQVATLGTLSGSIVDDRGAAVPDAALTLSRDGTVIRVTQAEVTGKFTLSGLAPG